MKSIYFTLKRSHINIFAVFYFLNLHSFYLYFNWYLKQEFKELLKLIALNFDSVHICIGRLFYFFIFLEAGKCIKESLTKLKSFIFTKNVGINYKQYVWKFLEIIGKNLSNILTLESAQAFYGYHMNMIRFKPDSFLLLLL